MPDTLTDAELDAIEARAEAATPGPWRACAWDPMERPHVHKDTPGVTVCRAPTLPELLAFAAQIEDQE